MNARGEPIHVVAGVLRDRAGRVLLAQRPQGKDFASLWEFPGGKCEPGEDPQEALRRELREELGIETGALEHLIGVPWRYAHKSIFLDVYTVRDYTGDPHAREHQALRWADPARLSELPMPPADLPVTTALRLPSTYVISPEPGETAQFLRAIQSVIDSGAKLIQLRAKSLSPMALRPLAAAVRDLTAAAGATLLLNGHLELVQELALDGVHLSAAELRRHTRRPLAPGRWVAASCHDAQELQHAAAIGADFVVLGPVRRTASHPDAVPLGWQAFAQLCASVPLPVYALGGLSESDVGQAVAAGAQGVAGISAFWP